MMRKVMLGLLLLMLAALMGCGVPWNDVNMSYEAGQFCFEIDKEIVIEGITVQVKDTLCVDLPSDLPIEVRGDAVLLKLDG